MTTQGTDMKILRLLPLVAAIILCFSTAWAIDGVPSPEWDSVLDGLIQQGWRDPAGLTEPFQKEEVRIKQPLDGYVAAWDAKLIATTTYTDKSRENGACLPSAYCSADILGARKLIENLLMSGNQLSSYLLEKISPQAQLEIKAYLDNPASTNEPPKLLMSELSRIIGEEALYNKARFKDVKLSPVTKVLVEQFNSDNYRVCINKTLLAEAYPDALAKNVKCIIYKNEVRQRLVMAKTLQYLRTGKRDEALVDAVRLTEGYEWKESDVVSFWYYYPRLLLDVHKKDNESLIKNAYEALNNSIIAYEMRSADKPEKISSDLNTYRRILANIILTGGIAVARMEGLESLESLGPLVWMIGGREETKLVDGQADETMQQIYGVREYLSGPESDNFRLNYAVAMYKGKRRYGLLMEALDKKDTARAVKLFEEARDYQQLAYTWAGTGRGKAAAVASNLELINTGLVRMKEVLPVAIYTALVEQPGVVDGEITANLIREMGENDRKKEGWEGLRFADRKGLVDGTHRLWNVFGKNTVLVGDYYLKRTDTNDFYSVTENTNKILNGLERYFSTSLFQEQINMKNIETCLKEQETWALMTKTHYTNLAEGVSLLQKPNANSACTELMRNNFK